MVTQQAYTYERYHKRSDPRDKPPGCFDDLYRQESTVHQGYEPAPTDVRLISARIYPNGEFGVGFLPREKKRAEDKRYDKGEINGCTTELVLVPDVVISPDGDKVIYTRRYEERVTPKLGIGAELSQEKKKYGLKGITGHGRKMLRNAGYLIDQATKGKYGALPQMGTLTIPSLEPDAMRVIATNWAYIQKRFFEKCKRRYAKLGLRFDYASCTEIQPGRWVERGEIGLHIHFLFVSYRLGGNQWSLPDQWVRDQWKSTLESVLGKGSISGNLNYRRETIRTSSAAYLAKYASKGTEFIREVAERNGTDVLPSQWWSVSSALRRCIKASILSSTGLVADALLYLCKKGDTELIRYARCAVIDTSYTDCRDNRFVPRELVLGYGGMLTKEGIAAFLSTRTDAYIKRYLPITVDRLNGLA